MNDRCWRLMADWKFIKVCRFHRNLMIFVKMNKALFGGYILIWKIIWIVTFLRIKARLCFWVSWTYRFCFMTFNQMLQSVSLWCVFLPWLLDSNGLPDVYSFVYFDFRFFIYCFLLILSLSFWIKRFNWWIININFDRWIQLKEINLLCFCFILLCLIPLFFHNIKFTKKVF